MTKKPNNKKHAFFNTILTGIIPIILLIIQTTDYVSWLFDLGIKMGWAFKFMGAAPFILLYVINNSYLCRWCKWHRMMSWGLLGINIVALFIPLLTTYTSFLIYNILNILLFVIAWIGFVNTMRLVSKVKLRK